MRSTPHATRLVLGLVTPAVLVVASSLVAGFAASVGGCATEQTTSVGSARGGLEAPAVEGREVATATGYAGYAAYTKGGGGEPGRGRDEVAARTLASTAGLFPSLEGSRGLSRAGQPTVNPFDELLGSAGGGASAGNRQANGWVAASNGLCPPDMASIDDRFCVDRYEASLLEVLPDGTEKAFSPYESLKGQVVRAVSEPGVYPQGYISEVQAIQACSLSGKRLCKAKEWRQACMGPEKKSYGYAEKSEPGKCNDHGRSPMAALYANENLSSRDKWDWERMNRPELNQLDGTLAHTGEHDECTNGYGVYDMVGNLHEWVDDPNGTFQGGYYQDTTINGEGCHYVTMAHEARYHDYSTGFRCCSDVAP